MPKIIDDLRETLLTAAREMLLKDGGRALTIRNIAARCHVAVGTVYNYFSSKDELMASVMLEDWQEALRRMKEESGQAADVLTGLRCIHDRLQAFDAQYRPAWMNYAASNDAAGQIRKRHSLLIRQLVELISPLLSRCGCLWTETLPGFLAETLLTCAGRGEGCFDRICPVLNRLIRPE